MDYKYIKQKKVTPFIISSDLSIFLFIKYNMHFPKYLLLFVHLLILTTQLEQITVIYHQGTAKKTEHLIKNYYQYTVASYGPKPSQNTWNLSITKDLQLCKLNQEQYIKKSEEVIRTRRAILVARGNCSFTLKTKNAQKLGYDLIIISETADVPILPTPEGNDLQITIPTIMISYKDGGKLRAMLPFCPQGIEIILGWQQSLKYYKLPNIGFNIADVTKMAYREEVYLTFQNFTIITTLNSSNHQWITPLSCFIITYKNVIIDLVLQTTNAYFLGRNSSAIIILNCTMEQHYQDNRYQIGRRLWWKYVVLFNQNACFLNQNIDKCFEACLKEIKISTKTINLITQMTNNMTNAHFWQFKILYPKMETIEQTSEKIQNQYQSLIDKTLLEICHSEAKKPIEICKKITHQDISLTIKDYNQTSYEFIQPVGRKDSNVTQLIRIRLSQQVLSSLDEVLIILSRCPGVVQYQFKKCQPFEYQKHTGKVQLTGKFGNWNKSQLTDDSIQLYSVQKYGGNLNIMNLKRKEIIQENITLLLKLPSSYRTYFNILPKKTGIKLIRSGDVELGYIADTYKIYELLFEDVTTPLFNSYAIKIEGHFSIIETSLFRTSTRQSTFTTYTQRADPFFYYYSFPAIIFSNYSRNTYQIICNGNTQINCSMFLSINLKNMAKNELFRISVIRFNQNLIYSIQPYQPFYNGNSHTFDWNISRVYVQLAKLRNFGDRSFGNYTDSSIVLYTGYIANNIEVSFQICVEDYLCEIKSIKEWEQLEKNNKTRTLKHYQSKTSARNSFQNYISTKFYDNVQHVSFANPANSFRRFLKVDKLNVYIVYRQKNYQRNETIRPRLLFPPKWRWDVIDPSANFVYSLSQSCEFNIQKTSSRISSNRFILIHKKIDENVRIYSRIIRQDFYEDYFKTISLQTSNTLINSIFRNYYYLDLHADIHSAFKIQIIVEDKLKRIVDEDASYYSIGWSTYPISSAEREIQLLEVDDRHVFAYTEKYTKGMPKYVIKSTSNVIILHFNPERSVFQDKVVLCTIQQCFNHSHFKVWKDLKTNQLVTGLKVNSKIKSGFVLQVLDYKIANISESEYNLSLKSFEQLPIQVRIQTKAIQNLIEIKQINNYQHVQQYEDTKTNRQTASQQVEYVDQKPIQNNVDQTPYNKTNISEGAKEDGQIKNSQNKIEQKQKSTAKEQPNSKEEIQKEQSDTIKQKSQEQDHKKPSQPKQTQKTEYSKTEENKNIKQIVSLTQSQNKPQMQSQTLNDKQLAIQVAIILVTLLIVCILLMIAVLLFKLIRIIPRKKLDIHQLYQQSYDITSSNSDISEQK